jgi:hypothetical protein
MCELRTCRVPQRADAMELTSWHAVKSVRPVLTDDHRGPRHEDSLLNAPATHYNV